MTQNAGLFIGQEDVLVLINDVEPGRADLEIGIFLARLLEKFIVDVELEGVSFLQARVALGALRVQLDALETDVFL